MNKDIKGHGLMRYSAFVVGGISLSPDRDEDEACQIIAKELKRAGINPARLRFHIYRRSVDARKKPTCVIISRAGSKKVVCL